MADQSRTQGFGTRAIRVASTPPVVNEQANSVPIYQAATFAADDAAELGDILADRKPGYAYARIDNPTASALAAAVAELEGAEAGFALSSGMAAIHAALVSLLHAGDRIVSTRAVYGSTRALMTQVLSRFDVDVTFVDATDADAVEAALPGARVLYLETISNPTIQVADLSVLAERAHRHGVTVVVDNTFASPYLCRPLELGADLVVESCTKWLGGHSDVVAGSVCGSRELIAEVRALETEAGAIVAPVQRVPGPARDRDAARADGAALQLRARAGALPRGATGGPARPLSRASRRIRRRPPRSGCCVPAGACSRSTWVTGRPRRRSSMRSRFRRVPRPWGASRRSPCIRRPARTGS